MIEKNNFEEIKKVVTRNYLKGLREEERKKQQQALAELADRAQGVGFDAASEDANCYMNFDGENLDMYRGNQLQYRVPAMSGNPSYQQREYQNVVDRGPLPEGVYYTNNQEPAPFVQRAFSRVLPDIPTEVPTNHNYFQHIDAVDEMQSRFGRGKWPSGVRAWGDSRIKLLPDENNNMMGRGGFYIHGGEVPGSNGCVDVNQYMPVVESYGNTCQPNIPIRVKYPRQSW